MVILGVGVAVGVWVGVLVGVVVDVLVGNDVEVLEGVSDGVCVKVVGVADPSCVEEGESVDVGN